uniref:YbeY metalloendoribonuclease n=1 Tax=Macaca mulatta TaxID=9544 RepID=F6S0W3_MACMU
MSLVIRNLQRVIPIRRAPLRSKIEIVRRILGVQKFDLGIICVDNKNIQHINRIYRGRNVPTDVLSFPFHEHLKAGEFPLPEFPDDYNLGDIFLGVEYIFHQCKEDEDYNDVLTVTATHGLCHLLGFTHSTEAEWQQQGALKPGSTNSASIGASNTWGSVSSCQEAHLGDPRPLLTCLVSLELRAKPAGITGPDGYTPTGSVLSSQFQAYFAAKISP